MGITDPIADMATLIRNASNSGKENVDVKASGIKEEILKILKNERFIQNYKKIVLNYPDIPFENREGPVNHNFKTVTKEDNVQVFRKIKNTYNE